MPIIGLTTKTNSFPCLGKIRKGAAKPKTGNKPGADLDYFRFEGTLPAYTEQFYKLYEPEPKALVCWLPYSTIEANFDSWMEEYGKSQLKRRCDGEFQTLWADGKNYSQDRKPCESGSCGCKPTGRLKVLLPKLLDAGLVGYVLVTTTSKHDLMELSANLGAAYAMSRNLSGVRFVLQRSPRMISIPTEQGRARVEKHLLTISPDPEWVQMQMSRQEIEQGLTPTLALPSADDDDVIEVEAIAPPTDYRQSKAWQTMVSLFQRAATEDRIQQAIAWANQRIEDGDLPIMARNGIDREAAIAREKIANSF